MNIRIQTLLEKKWTIPAIAGVVGIASGGGLGYILGSRRRPAVIELEPYFDAKVFNEPIISKETFVAEIDPELQELLTEENLEVDHVEFSLKEEVVEPEVEPKVVNIFVSREGVSGEWDYELERSHRDPNHAYVISLDEYFEDDAGCGQSTITYYQGDDILTDENDVPIYNYPSVVGELKFGHGSNDPNVVYIRNEKLKAEWEILLSTGRYEVEIMGLHIQQDYEEGDIKHNNEPWKFRDR